MDKSNVYRLKGQVYAYLYCVQPLVRGTSYLSLFLKQAGIMSKVMV